MDISKTLSVLIYTMYSQKFQKVHREAIGQRDTIKMVVMRHEHNAQSAAKARSKSAFELRQQVDEHKQELERLERKLLTSSKIIESNIAH